MKNGLPSQVSQLATVCSGVMRVPRQGVLEEVIESGHRSVGENLLEQHRQGEQRTA